MSHFFYISVQLMHVTKLPIKFENPVNTVFDYFP